MAEEDTFLILPRLYKGKGPCQSFQKCRKAADDRSFRNYVGSASGFALNQLGIVGEAGLVSHNADPSLHSWLHDSKREDLPHLHWEPNQAIARGGEDPHSYKKERSLTGAYHLYKLYLSSILSRS